MQGPTNTSGSSSRPTSSSPTAYSQHDLGLRGNEMDPPAYSEVTGNGARGVEAREAKDGEADHLLHEHHDQDHDQDQAQNDTPPRNGPQRPRYSMDSAAGTGGGAGRGSYDGRSLQNGGGDGASLYSNATSTGVATVEQKKALWWRNVLITALFIASWYGFATLLSLYNKWMFTPKYYNFPFPLFVTTCHMVVQFCCSWFILTMWPKRFRPVERPTRKDYVSKVFPAAFSTGGDIGLSNKSLELITLSLYTMAKSSTLLFVLLAAFAFRIEKPSFRLVSVICLISFGVFLMVFNTTEVNVAGLIMVFSASGLAGLRWALTELVMHKKAMGLSNPFATIYWLAPLMGLCLAVVSISAEGWFNVFRSEHLQGPKAILTVGVIIFPGCLAFAMVSSEYFIIHRAGSVPLSIAGIFKEVTTISISAIVFGDQLTELNIIGVAITVCGIIVYTYHKYQKSIAQTVPLDTSGNPILPEPEIDDEEDEAPLSRTTSHHAHASYSHHPEHQPLTSNAARYDRLPLDSLPTPRNSDTDTSRDGHARNHSYSQEQGYGDADEALEAGDDEVERLRAERDGKHEVKPGGWGPWWDKTM